MKSRLLEFVEAHRTKDWATVFNYLDPQYTTEATKPYTEKEFVGQKFYSRVNRFTPTSFQKMADGWWMIWGCGSFSDGATMESGLDAHFKMGTWFFSDIWSSPPCVDCTPKTCSHKGASKK